MEVGEELGWRHDTVEPAPILRRSYGNREEVDELEVTRAWRVSIIQAWSRFLLLCFAALACYCAVWEVGAEAQVQKRVFRVDNIDGHGTVGFVQLQQYVIRGQHGPLNVAQLLVRTPSGRVLWAGPRPTTEEGTGYKNGLVFGSLEFDGGDIEVIGRIRGTIQLIGDSVYSDAGPHALRLLQWQGNAFRFVRWGVLAETPGGSGHYVWSNKRLSGPPYGPANVTWISEFAEIMPDGACLVRISHWDASSPAGYRNRPAVVVQTSDGFRLRR